MLPGPISSEALGLTFTMIVASGHVLAADAVQESSRRANASLLEKVLALRKKGNSRKKSLPERHPSIRKGFEEEALYSKR